MNSSTFCTFLYPNCISVWQAELPSPEEDEAIMSIIFVSFICIAALRYFSLTESFSFDACFALERKGFFVWGKNNSIEMMNQDLAQEKAWNFLKSTTYYIIFIS